MSTMSQINNFEHSHNCQSVPCSRAYMESNELTNQSTSLKRQKMDNAFESGSLRLPSPYNNSEDEMWNDLQDVRSQKVYQIEPKKSHPLNKKGDNDKLASLKRKILNNEESAFEVEEVPIETRENFVCLVHRKKYSVKDAAKLLKLRLSTAKAIMRLFKKEDKLMDQILQKEDLATSELMNQTAPTTTVTASAANCIDQIPNGVMPNTLEMQVANAQANLGVSQIVPISYQIRNVTTTHETYTVLPNNQVLFNVTVETTQEVTAIQRDF